MLRPRQRRSAVEDPGTQFRPYTPFPCNRSCDCGWIVLRPSRDPGRASHSHGHVLRACPRSRRRRQHWPSNARRFVAFAAYIDARTRAFTRIDPAIAASLGFPKPEYTAVERERRWLCDRATPTDTCSHVPALETGAPHRDIVLHVFAAVQLDARLARRTPDQLPMRIISLAASLVLLSLVKTASAEPSPITETRSAGDVQRAWGWVTTAFGSTLLFVGAYSYARVDSLQTATTDEGCDSRSGSNASACESVRWRRIFWLSAPLGAVSTATGIALLATAPDDHAPSWRIHATAGSHDLELKLGTSF